MATRKRPPARRRRKSRAGKKIVSGTVTFTFNKSGVLRIKHGALNRAMRDWLETARGAELGAQLVLGGKGAHPTGTNAGCGPTPINPNTMCACDTGCPPGI